MQFLLPLVLVGFLVLMWLSFRGQSRRRGELAHMQATLEVGDEVMLTCGIHGVLREVEDDDPTVRLEIADGVVVRVARGAVGELVGPDLETDDDEPADVPTEGPARERSAREGTARDSDVSEEN